MFGNQDINDRGFQASTIGESCIIRDSERIPITSTDREPGPYPYYGANGIQDYVKDYIFDGEFVLMAEDGGYFDDISRPNCYYVSGKCWVNNHAHILQPRESLNIHYLDWSIKYRDLTALVNGTTRAKLTQSAMRTIPIFIPPIHLQNEFASFLKQVDKSKFSWPRSFGSRTANFLAISSTTILSFRPLAYPWDSYGELRLLQGIPSILQVC